MNIELLITQIERDKYLPHPFRPGKFMNILPRRKICHVLYATEFATWQSLPSGCVYVSFAKRFMQHNLPCGNICPVFACTQIVYATDPGAISDDTLDGAISDDTLDGAISDALVKFSLFLAWRFFGMT